MRIRGWLIQNINWMIAFLFTLGLAVFAGLRFDCYFDLNDDILMKNILSGVYTGTPDGHNIYMLWPLGALISLCYRIAGSLPWYGLFLTGCHYVCIFLILNRSLHFCQTNPGKVAVALTETVLLSALLLNHLVLVQYTVTSGILAGTAVFLLVTEQKTGKQMFWGRSAILLVILAFLIRSTMLLLVLPLICTAGIIRWGSEKVIFTKEHAIQYFSIFGVMILGLLVGQGSHLLAYSSEEWRTFEEFNDNRTEIYDFQGIPSYEGNEAFYESVGLTESEKLLLDNYNFGMDEEINEKVVGEVAAYAGEIRSEEQSFDEKLKDKFFQYVYRFTRGHGVDGSDFPWNYAVIIGYLSVFVLSLAQRKWGVFWKLPLLLGVRTLLWLYLLMRGRSPERVTHSLYLVELCILGAMLLTEGSAMTYIKEDKSAKRTGRQVLIGLCMCIFLWFGLAISSEQITGIEKRSDERFWANNLYQELFAHLSAEESAENFYFIDVYSWASVSERVFEKKDNSLDNYDIMGGWICKSPLQRKKMENFGIDTMEQALRESDNVYFVKLASIDMGWMKDYYAGHGTPVEPRLVETIADKFEIYAVEAVNQSLK